MINCPECGAENKPTAMVCRMCATPLGATSSPGSVPSERADSLPPTVIFADQNAQGSSSGSSNPDGIACPTCQTMNEVGWAFCQQCGSKLQQGALPGSGQGQKTVAERAPDHPADPQQGKPTSRPQPAVTQTPPRQGQQTVVARPAGADQSFPPGKPTVVERPVNVEQPPPKQQPAAQPQSPPPSQASSASPGGGTEVVQSVKAPAAGGAPCPQCGHQNHPGSSFCAACGTPMTVAKTIVMSSVAAKAKGRLHLIMEGGQPGEVYELEDETIVGRTGGDISFPHDGFMSGRHARIVRRDDSFILTDEESRNGTFIKIKGEVELKPGDMILIGKQLFRFDV